MRVRLTLSLALLAATSLAVPAAAQCPLETPLRHYTGAGSTVCPCFVAGEEAGAVFDAPASHYPIEITNIRIGWGSIFGGNPASLEQALKIYPAGLPNPGTAQFSVLGPQLFEQVINDFDISSLPGNRVVSSGPFSISLQFFNSQGTFSSSVVHDGNGCQAGRNTVRAIPGGWSNACALGVSGDWVMEVVYRQVNCEPPGPKSGVAPTKNPKSVTKSSFLLRSGGRRATSHDLPIVPATWLGVSPMDVPERLARPVDLALEGRTFETAARERIASRAWLGSWMGLRR